MKSVLFAQPHWFWLLLLLPVLFLAAGRFNRAQRELRRFAEPHLWPWIIRDYQSARLRLNRRSMMLLITSLAIVAATGPTLLSDTGNTDRVPVTDLAIVIDISASMAGQDLKPDRLQRARLEINTLLDRLHHHRIALIAFAANAYPLLPLTEDLSTVRYFINHLDSDMTSRQGSRLAHALKLAHDTVMAGQQHSRAVLLVSDGDIHDAMAANRQAEKLAGDDIPLFILGSATTAGSPVADAQGHYLIQDGQAVVSRLQETTLQQLATISKGRYTRVSVMDGDTDILYQGLMKLEQKSQHLVHHGGMPLAPWLIATCLVLLLWFGRRQLRVGIISTAVLAVLLTLPRPGHTAVLWQQQQAWQALQNGQYEKAAQLYRDDSSVQGRLGLGAAWYRLRQYKRAQAAFRQAADTAATSQERVMALYNLGNTQLMLGNPDQARSSYQRVLALSPMHKQAAYNLGLIGENRLPAQADKPVTEDRRITQPDQRAPEQSSGTDQDNTSTAQRKMARVLAQWQLDNPSHGDQELETAQRQLRGIEPSPRTILRQRIGQMDKRADTSVQEQPW